ncbi:proline-rich protein PRCC [Armigeres subalbatus]|uniref:proline-rich protein PRCC n=1 Tax=Armigeres subalbatus TaxID=124917 RepID=UPI002ED35E12
MSLVAYDYSSDEESDHDELDEQPVAPVAVLSIETSNVPESNIKVTPPQQSTPTSDDTIDDEEESVVHLPLPAPKKITINNLNVEEEDDEFLHKKAIPEVKPTLPPPPPSLASARSNIKNGKVQITIPSLKDFKEDNDNKPKTKPTVSAQLPERATGLLGMLPKPKSEIGFSTSSSAKNGPAPAGVKPIVNRLIPDSVANRPRNVHPDSKLPKKPFPKNQNTLPKSSAKDDESSDDDEEKIDFFSLNMDEKLPEISSNEINAMVAKRAARMAAAVEKFDKPSVPEQEPGPSGFHQVHSPSLPNPNDLANEQALSSLIGGNKAKRARLDEVNIIDINSEDIVPSKEDFMRRKLQEETGYVPTGHLTGDWTCTSKRKSHITYLASKAQANAQELEAMWSANRQSRRQTQSKYGF